MSRAYPIRERAYDADLEARIDACYAEPASAPNNRSLAWERWVPEFDGASTPWLEDAVRHLRGLLNGGYYEYRTHSRQADERLECLAKVRAITHILDQRRRGAA